MSPRLRLAATGLGVYVFVLGVLGAAALRSHQPGCSAPAPIPVLSSRLRALGDLDQPIDPSRVDELEDLATRAAAAEGVDLGGAVAAPPVRLRPRGAARYDALVVPLTRRDGGDHLPAVVGLVAFAGDCSGRARYLATENAARNRATGSLPTAFPSVSRDAASRRFPAPADPVLVYETSPFRPLWLDPRSGRTVAAQP